MPNWKKVILSGSNAILSEITASNVPSSGINTENLLAIDATTGGFIQIPQNQLNAIEDADWHILSNTHLTASRDVHITGSLRTTKSGSFLEGAVTISPAEAISEIFTDGHITASGHISGSGMLFASLSLDSSNFKTVMYDTSSGKFFFTGSYGGGGGSSTGTGTPGGNIHDVQFNDGAGNFAGSDEFSFNPNVNGASTATVHVGTSEPNNATTAHGLRSGSHIIATNQHLVTNAQFAQQFDSFYVVGLNGSKNYRLRNADNNILEVADQKVWAGHNNGLPPSASNPNYINAVGLNGDVINGGLAMHGAYVYVKGNQAYYAATGFLTHPGSPAILTENGSTFYFPSASSAYDNAGSGSFITPFASASGRITLTEPSNPANSSFDIIGRKNTLYKTGESGSEESYMIYDNSLDIIGLGGKGLTVQNIDDNKDSATKVYFHDPLTANSAVHFKQDVNFTPTVFNSAIGNNNTIFFGGNIGTKQGTLATHPNNKQRFTSRVTYTLNGGGGVGGGTGRPFFDVEDSDLSIGKKRSGSEDVRGGVLITSNPNIFFFNETNASASISGGLIPGSASAQIKFDTGSNALKFFAGSTKETLKEVLHISKSGDNPRIGIGTTNPKTVFDFKDVEDTTTGAELLIRSARSTQGALTGDEGGSINFVIDSGSFTNLKTSGSLAKIKTKVANVGVGGAQGTLIFELSKGFSESHDIFQYGFNIGGQALFATVQTASLIIKDFNAPGESILQMRDFNDGVRFEVNDGDVEMSGSLGVTGSATFNSNVDIDGTLSLGEFTDVSASLAAAVAGGDNLGNHTANRDLDLDSNNIKDVLHITASGNISASGVITANSFIGTLTGTATGLAGTPNITVGSIEAVSLNVTSITSSIVTSSIIQTEGSNIFGDAISDTQTFNGNITASGDISASGNVIAPNLIADSASFSTRVTANDAKVSYTDAAVTSVINAAGIISSSAQIASSISGSFTATSASFSTRVTTNDAKVSYTDAAVKSKINAEGVISSSAQIASNISGSFTAVSASFSTRVTANDAKVSYTDAAVTNVINTAGVISSSAQLDFVDTTGTPANNQLAVFTDADTIEGAQFLNFTNQGGLVINNAASGVVDTGLKVHGNIFGSGSLIRLKNPKPSGGDAGFYLSASGDLAGGSFKIFAGDIEGVGNSTLLTVDDENEQITTSKALGVTGNITVTGTVDGRDVAADGTKLDGITATRISGSFTAVSASFSTRVTTNDAKVSYTDAAVTSVINAAGILSSSAQISSNISGAFAAASGGFSTRVNTLEGNVGQALNTDSTVEFANVTSSKIAIKGGGSSAPAIHYHSDGDTGLFFPAANTVALQAAGGDTEFQVSSDTITAQSNRFHVYGNITASGNISASGQIIAEAGPTINTTLASNSATNIDTFNTSSNNGAIYDYTLFSAPSGARAGQCMVIHHNGNTDFTDTSTPTLGSETSIPFFETAVNGANVEVKIASGSGYTFKAFVKKL